MDMWANAAVVISNGKPKKQIGINPATVQLHPPDIPHEITCDRTGDSSVKRHRVTA
jgi:hypothetical protein